MSDAVTDAINAWIESCQLSFVILFVGWFLFLICYNKTVNFVLCGLKCINYKDLDGIKQRKVLIYLSSILVRGSSLVILTIMLFDFWTFKDGFSIDECYGIKLLQILSVEFTSLMIFELIKLPELSWDMWMHHMIIIILACTLMDNKTIKTPFRTDPYYVESTIFLITGGCLMFIYQLFWVLH